MARALADHAEASIDLVDTILTGVVERVQHGELAAEPDGCTPSWSTWWPGRPRCKDCSCTTPTAAGCSIRCRALRPCCNNADREYFTYHRMHADKAAHVGSPVRSRSSGAWVIPVSRRLEHPTAALPAWRWRPSRSISSAAFYESFGIGDKGAIFLASDNGQLRRAAPFNENDVGADISERSGVPGCGKQRGVKPAARSWSPKSTRSSGCTPTATCALPAADRGGAVEGRSAGALAHAARWSACAGTLMLLLALLLLGTRMIRQLIERDRLQRRTARRQDRARSEQRLAAAAGADRRPDRPGQPAPFRPAPRTPNSSARSATRRRSRW